MKRGVVDFGVIKTTINLGKAKTSKSPTKKDADENARAETESQLMVQRPSRKTNTENGLVDSNDQNLKDETLTIQIEGRVNVGAVPR